MAQSMSKCFSNVWMFPDESKSEARVLFRAGKNCDGWFAAEYLFKHMDHTIDIFEGKTNGRATGLFLFDNAPSHQNEPPMPYQHER